MDSVLFCKAPKFALVLLQLQCKWINIFFQTLTAIRTCRPARKQTFSGTNPNLLNQRKALFPTGFLVLKCVFYAFFAFRSPDAKDMRRSVTTRTRDTSMLLTTPRAAARPLIQVPPYLGLQHGLSYRYHHTAPHHPGTYLKEGFGRFDS